MGETHFIPEFDGAEYLAILSNDHNVSNLQIRWRRKKMSLGASGSTLTAEAFKKQSKIQSTGFACGTEREVRWECLFQRGCGPAVGARGLILCQAAAEGKAKGL